MGRQRGEYHRSWWGQAFRGLTLEGLSISYYLRSARGYDTLMQMGRWFGYRDGFTDLCRIYTTQQLLDWYRFISTANQELWSLFEEMENTPNMTPINFGLKVRKHLVCSPLLRPAKDVMQSQFGFLFRENSQKQLLSIAKHQVTTCVWCLI